MVVDVIGEKDMSCPWCGKPFVFWESGGMWNAVCSNSYCLVVPYAQHDSFDTLQKAIRNRIKG